MANTLKVKRSSVAGKVPTTSEIAGGELGVNMVDKKIFINNGTAIEQVGSGTLAGLSDSAVANPLNNDYLVYNGTKWINTDRLNAKTIFETVKNVSGASIAKGTPVYQIGTSGNAVTVGPARADDPNKVAIGVMDETTADQAEGRMLVLGEIKGVNTSGFASGDKVYLGTTGGYTNVAPTASGVFQQFLGVVFRVDANNGSGYITGTLTKDVVRWNGSALEAWTGTAWTAIGGVSSFNTRTGAITLSSGDVTGALGFTPYNATNPNGYITSSGSISGNAATATTATNVSGGTASVSTLSASDAVTLSGGTAGGVAYLNGSKVLTSGSALTYNGTLLEVAAATAVATGKFSHTGNLASGAVVIGDPNDAASITGLYLRSTTKANINFSTGSVLAFNNDGSGGSELMRLTSTGLGIGTSSPVTKLNVVDASTNTFVGAFRGAGGSNLVALGTTAGGASIAGYTAGFAAPADLIINPSGGNLGLGITPSAWGNNFKAYQVGLASLAQEGSNGILELSYNAYGSSAAVRNYIVSAGATTYQQTLTGQHRWFTAPSGTAGNAISFTQAMTLTANGNLLLGGTNENTSRLLDLVSATKTQLTLTYPGVIAWGAAAVSTGALTFGNNTNGECLRLDSSGNLGLGVTPSAWGSVFKSFDINGGAVSATSGGALVESGNAYFNGSSWIYKGNGSATRVELNAGAAGAAWYTAPSGTAGNAISFTQAMTLNASGNLLVGTTTSGGYRLEVSGTAAATDFNSTSDRTKKHNITTITDAISKVQQLRGVEFDWIADDKHAIGVIAQEVEQVLPSVVQGTEGNKTVSYGNIVGVLIEAIKEQQQTIAALTQRVTELENRI